MIIINLRALMQKKGAIEGRKITYRDIEEKTGISSLTLSRAATNHNYNIKRGDLEKLLDYFGCLVDELLIHIKR